MTRYSTKMEINCKYITKTTKYVGPGGWNDPDMLQVGNGNFNC